MIYTVRIDLGTFDGEDEAEVMYPALHRVRQAFLEGKNDFYPVEVCDEDGDAIETFEVHLGEIR